MSKILVAYDGTEPANRALERAARLARSTGASLTVVGVVPARASRGVADPSIQASDSQRLVQAKKFLTECGLAPILVERSGDPALEIEQLVTRDRFETVVIGSRGLGEAERVLKGSVSEHVRSHVHATVIVVD